MRAAALFALLLLAACAPPQKEGPDFWSGVAGHMKERRQ